MVPHCFLCSPTCQRQNSHTSPPSHTMAVPHVHQIPYLSQISIQDNHPTHTAADRIIHMWRQHDTSTLSLLRRWPSNSPDQSPVENMWACRAVLNNNTPWCLTGMGATFHDGDKVCCRECCHISFHVDNATVLHECLVIITFQHIELAVVSMVLGGVFWGHAVA